MTSAEGALHPAGVTDATRPVVSAAPLLSMRGITKRFGSVLANDSIDLDVRSGEVHALLGENGAGKSTLMKILYGFYLADSGETRLDGRPVRIRSPHDARRLRIGMVFQDFTLVPAFTVLENIALFLPDVGAVPNRREIASRISEVSARYGMRVDPQSFVWQLSVGEQQRVEILKLLLADSKLLILDEPTKVLAPHEVEGLFRVFAKLKGDGYAVVFITHKLQEVISCADRITVLRHGTVAGQIRASDATEDTLVRMMFGSSEAEVRHERRSTVNSPGVGPLLELRGVSTAAHGTATCLRDIDLVIRPGEILGVAGVSGNGQRELGDLILGLERCTGGTKLVLGQDATHWAISRIRRSGVAFVPEDPLTMAAVPWMSLRENMVLADTSKYSRKAGLDVDWATARHDLEASVERLGVTIPPSWMPLATLSGGNVQRFTLARELAGKPRVIVAFYPTRGLDVPSANAARAVLLAAREAGTGILLISEDLGELFDLSDRLVVLRRGRIAGTFRPHETTLNEVGHLMTGSESTSPVMSGE